MPTLRDWLETIAFLIAFFTVLSVTDPAAAADLSGIGQERTMNRYLTEPEQARLLETLKGASGDPLAARDYAWVRALRHSGLRITEFALINVGDALAALRTGYLFIPREHRKGWKRTEREGAPKRNPPKDHQTYVTNALREALEDLLKCRLLPLGDLGCSENAPLIVARHGRRLSVRSYQMRLAYWAERAGLPPGVSPHWLRHTRAMNIMRESTARDPRGVVQSALGHADIRSTGIYTQTPREDVEAALDAIDTTKPRRVTRAVLRREFERRATA
jgi:site-specific recombinase XerC